jgi:hypothetical protein
VNGPEALYLSSHALAPVAELPVLKVVSTIHILADLTLGLGKVAPRLSATAGLGESHGHLSGKLPSRRHHVAEV